MFMYLARFTDAADVLIGPAPDPDTALIQLKAHGIERTPAGLHVVPPGIVCGELHYLELDEDDDDASGDDEDGEVLVIEATDVFADWLDVAAAGGNVAAALAEMGTAPTEPAPEGNDRG